MRMRKMAKGAVAVGLASVLAVSALATTAWGYFTDQVRASGERELSFGYDYDTKETIEGTDKVVSIQNTGPTEVAARVLVFGAGADDALGRTVIEPGAGWAEQPSEQGTCYSYARVLAPGESTTELRVSLSWVVEGIEAEPFEVTVIGQASPVAYDEDGSWYAYSWAKR